MHLVKAAKYDVATMLLQEKELFKFNQNLGTSSGKGPSQAVRDAKDKKKQLQEAEDFVNILDDEAILLEGQQTNNPTTFIPKEVEKHRAKEDGPKCKRITSLANETRDHKGSRKKKRAKKSIEGPDEGKIREKIFLVCEVLKMRYEEVIKLKSEDGKRQNGKEKPPTVIITDGLGIHVCKGCPQGIQKDEQKYPRNMVFQCKGIVGYYNRVLNKWIQHKSNIHVDLSMQCLCKHDQTVEMRNISMNDEVWQNLTREQMQVLNDVGILKYLLANQL